MSQFLMSVISSFLVIWIFNICKSGCFILYLFQLENVSYKLLDLIKKMLETRGSEVLVSVILSCWKFVSLLIIGSFYYCSLLSWYSWCYPQEEANITPSLLWYIMCKKGGSMYWKSFSPHVACLLMWFLMWLFYFIAW